MHWLTCTHLNKLPWSAAQTRSQLCPSVSHLIGIHELHSIKAYLQPVSSLYLLMLSASMQQICTPLPVAQQLKLLQFPVLGGLVLDQHAAQDAEGKLPPHKQGQAQPEGLD